MTVPFSPALRRSLAERCQEFPRKRIEGQGLKRAAVALVVVEADDGSGEAALLLTRRAAGLRAHAHQWALPGGRCDEGEAIEAAALRELHEELGLSLGKDSLLGVLDDYETRSGYLVAPVVAWLDRAGTLQPNADEVASVHHIRLDQLAAAGAVGFVSIPESPRQVIRLNTSEGAIHAPTAALMYQLAELVQGRVTRVAHFEAPVFAWR